MKLLKIQCVIFKGTMLSFKRYRVGFFLEVPCVVMFFKSTVCSFLRAQCKVVKGTVCRL